MDHKKRKIVALLTALNPHDLWSKLHSELKIMISKGRNYIFPVRDHMYKADTLQKNAQQYTKTILKMWAITFMLH
jgi:hypothetical protein